MSKQLLSELENSPDAVLVIEAFQKMLKAEQKKREAFHDLVHDEMKAEFINGEVVIQSPVKRRGRGVKFTDYAAHRVAEYWIIDPDKKSLEQYVLDTGRQEYDLRTKLVEKGEIEAWAVPGFKVKLSQLFP